MNLSTKGILEIKGDFFVPRYQRGYRWSTEEVTLLLEIGRASCRERVSSPV